MPLKLWLCALTLALAQAAPAMNPLPGAPSYLGYVGSDNTATLDGDDFQAKREKLGNPMSIITHGQGREREMKNGYVTVFATWAQTTLRVPLGWYAVESKENLDESLVFSPGQTIQFVARAAVDNQEFQSDRDAFTKLKKASASQTRVRLQKLGLNAGPIERTDAPDGESFIIRAPKATDKVGHPFSYIEHFSQRSPKATRDIFWATLGTGQPMSPLQLPLAMSLLAPADKFEKYLPLFGLMVHDQGLNWAREESLSETEFPAQTPDATRFNAVADEAVALLKAGDVAGFQKRFPEAYEGESKANIAKYLTQTAVPFFKKLPEKLLRANVTVVRDHDPVSPLSRATLRRDFDAGTEFPSYVVAMEKVGGKIKLLGVATTDDPGAV